MSSMKQFAAEVLGDGEAAGLHGLTSAGFPKAGGALGEPWGRRQQRQAAKFASPAGMAGGRAGSPEERSPDLTICRDFGFATVRAVLRRRLAPQCRVLLCIDRLPSEMRILHRVVLAGVDAVLVPTDVLARAVHVLGVPASRIVLLAGRADLSPFDCQARSRAADGTCRIIHVGDLEPEAGVADFLLCIAAWAERNPQRSVEIRWCGEGCLRGVLEAQPLPPNVRQHFLGGTARGELTGVFLDCDILAVPTLADPWDDVVSEALAAQLAVLGSSQSRTVAEIVVHGTTGWIFDPFENGAMARAVNLALNTPPAELDRMRAHAAQRSKAAQPGLDERIWRAMQMKGAAPSFDTASLGWVS